MTSLKRILSFVCIICVALTLVPYSVAEGTVLVEPVELDNLSVYLYSDGEHTVPVSAEDITPWQRVFYRAECDEGYFLEALFVNATEVTNCSFMSIGKPDFTARVKLAGDFDNNDKISLSDAAWLLKYVAGWSTSPSWTITEDSVAGDVNRDRKINLTDAAAVLKIIAKWQNPHGGVQTDFHSATSATAEFIGDDNASEFGEDGYHVKGAGANLAKDSFALSATMADTANAAEITPDEFLAILRGETKPEHNAYRLTGSVVLSDAGVIYDGQEITVAGDVVLRGATGSTLQNLSVFGEIMIQESADLTLRRVFAEQIDERFGTDHTIYIDDDSRGVTVTDCRIINHDFMSIQASGDYFTLEDSYVEGGFIWACGEYATARGCEIISPEGQGISVSNGAVVRKCTITAKGEGIYVFSAENVLVCLNKISGSAKSVYFFNSNNCSVILNKAVSIYADTSSNIYVIDNALGGRFAAAISRNLIVDGNTHPEDGLDHTPAINNVANVNGDGLTDTGARVDVGANEDVLPHTDKDLFVGMERKTTVDGKSSITEYIRSSLAEDDVVIIPPGAYTATEPLNVEGVSDKRIYAYGVLEEFAEYSLGNTFTNCENLTVSGIAVGYEEQSSGQVYVLMVPGDSNYVKIVTAAGYVNDYGVTDLDTFFLNTQESDVYKEGAPNSHTSIAYHSIRKLDDGTMSMLLDDAEGIETGDVICCRLAHGNYTTIHLNTCTDVHFEDMTTYGCSDAICFAAIGKSSGITIDRWHNDAPPAPVIDKETYDRYAAFEEQYGIDLEISVDAEGRYRGSIPKIGSIDATHINGTTEGIIVTNSILESMCDDGSNHRGYNSRLHDVKVVGDVTEIYYKNSLPEWYALHSDILGGLGCELFETGDEVLIYTPDGRVFCNTNTLSATEGVEVIHYTVDGLDKEFYAPVYKITVPTDEVDMSALFDDDGDAKFDLSDNHYRMTNKVVVDNLSRSSASFTFDNVVVQNIRSRALCVKTTDATIKNCTFRGIGTGLLLYFESEWGESTVARDVLVEDCLFENTGYLYGDYGNIKYAPVSIIGPGADLASDSIPCRNITIEGCVFRDTESLYHIVVKNAANVTVTGNDFGYIYDREYEEYTAPFASVNIDNSKNVTVTDNTCPDGVKMSDWVKIKDSVNVTVE